MARSARLLTLFLVWLGAVAAQAGAAPDTSRAKPGIAAVPEVVAEAPKRKEGQSRRKAEPPAATPVAPVRPETAPPQPAETKPPEPVTVPPPTAIVLPAEKIEADVSTRAIAVTSGFTGTEIIVFGSVDNSRQPSAESGYYDVVVVVEGAPTPLVARKKSNVAGLWINTAAAAFDRVPSYYAIASTRPIEEIADAIALENNTIGFDFVRMSASLKTQQKISSAELRDYTDAVVRLKQKERLFVRKDYGVAFIGRSLFRSSIELPANVPVGPLTARAFLFREGQMISRFTTRVNLEREGVELLLYDFAGRYPFFYGLFAVTVAVAAGLLASAFFRRGTAV